MNVFISNKCRLYEHRTLKIRAKLGCTLQFEVSWMRQTAEHVRFDFPILKVNNCMSSKASADLLIPQSEPSLSWSVPESAQFKC